jgi:hypothetical protein
MSDRFTHHVAAIAVPARRDEHGEVVEWDNKFLRHGKPTTLRSATRYTSKDRAMTVANKFAADYEGAWPYTIRTL